MKFIQRFAFMQLIPFALCTEIQSVTLSCSVRSERKGSQFKKAQWTRGPPTGENLDKYPLYKGRLQKADQEAFGNEIICSTIFGLTERDAETCYCHIAGERQSVNNSNTLEIKCRTKETKNARTDITPILLGALALIAVLIVFLTFRLIWGNKTFHASGTIIIPTGSSDVQATTQALPDHGVAQEESLHYAQLNIQQGRKEDRVNRRADHVEYATVNSLSTCVFSEPRRPEFRYVNYRDPSGGHDKF